MLTRSQQRTYDFIRDYLETHGESPTYPEIAAGIGIRSVGVVHRYVQALIDNGYLYKESGRHRGLRLAQPDSDSVFTLPLLGKIAAGLPIEAIPGQDEIDMADFLMGPGRFALKVQGTSMIEAGILDGDVAIVKQQNRARKGEIVVALIDNEEATLKYFELLENGQVRLTPANSSMVPMVYDASRVQIQGVLTGCMRRYT